MKKILLFLLISMITIVAYSQTKTVGGPTTVGIQVTLKPYDGNVIYPFFWGTTYDTIQQVTNGTRYYVTESYSQYYSHPSVGNYIYWFIGVQAVSPSAPIQYLVWPSFYAKIAF